MIDRPKRRPLNAVKPANRLTPKQRRFAAEFIIDLNVAAASRRAGIARRYAIALLSKPHFLAHVEDLQAERTRRVQVDADWVLRRLMEELEADAADLFAADGTVKPVHEWPEIWRKGMVSGIRVTERDSSGRNVEIGRLKDVQFADRTKKIELLGRHISVQAFKERVQLGVENPLRLLFEQIAGQSVRPQIEGQAVRTPQSPSLAPPRPGLPLKEGK